MYNGKKAQSSSSQTATLTLFQLNVKRLKVDWNGPKLKISFRFSIPLHFTEMRL